MSHTTFLHSHDDFTLAFELTGFPHVIVKTWEMLPFSDPSGDFRSVCIKNFGTGCIVESQLSIYVTLVGELLKFWCEILKEVIDN